MCCNYKHSPLEEHLRRIKRTDVSLTTCACRRSTKDSYAPRPLIWKEFRAMPFMHRQVYTSSAIIIGLATSSAGYPCLAAVERNFVTGKLLFPMSIPN